MMKFPDAMRRAKNLYTYRHEPEYARSLAELFWRGLLVFVMIGIVGILFFAASVFWGVLDNLSTSHGPARLPTVLDRAALDSALLKIDERERDYNARASRPTPVVDPSR